MLNKKVAIPIFIFIAALCILGGMEIQRALSDDKVSEQVRKYESVLNLTSRYYVDNVDSQKLTEAAIRGMLEELDPHSVYIDPDQNKRVREDFQGSFEGIGVEFDIINDTLTVISPISGGPSEKLGIIAGDKIVIIDGISAIKITREDVPKKLRGPKGTKVKVNIIRSGMKQPMDFEITRDKIPLYSVDASFMYDNDIGYIKVSRFIATTYDEFSQALTKLKSQGMKMLMLDLRGNPGGYMDQAIKMASEFIPKGKKIVYTKSRIKDFEELYYSTGGSYTDLPLIILVNEGSASASEIVSGAIQDLDRGLIVGENTFGKGLVQRQFELADASSLRITISRYYTPSGRLIQKPYEGGKYKRNLMNPVDTLEGDNLNHQHDSKDTNRLEFKTIGGRKILGGGGITPDYLIKMDTLTSYSVQLRRLNVIYEYVESYMNSNRNRIQSSYNNYRDFRNSFEVDNNMLEGLKSTASKKGITYNSDNFSRDLEYLKIFIKSQIARDIWGNEGSYAVFVSTDEQVKKAASLFDEAAKLMKSNN